MKLNSQLECSAKGNIVLTLSTQNAARLLLKAVQDLNTTIVAAETERGVVREARNDRGEEKEKEFWAAVFERDPGVRLLPLDVCLSSPLAFCL